MNQAETEAEDMIRVAGELVTYVLFPGIGEQDFSERIDWRKRVSDKFEAAILPWRGTRYRVTIHTGVPARILSRLQEVELWETAVEAADRIGGVEAAMTLAWFSGVALFATHEACHAAAGHVAYQKAHFPEAWSRELGFRESLTSKPTVSYTGVNSLLEFADFRRFAELEADGVATAILLEAESELLRAVEGAVIDGSSQNVARRFILFGIFATLELLSAENKPSQYYPTPEVRFLNAVSAVFRHAASELISPESSDYKLRPAVSDEAETVLQNVSETIFPAIRMLDAVETASNFWDDIVTVLSGEPPGKTDAGRVLTRYTNDRSMFMRAMVDYRETGMWSEIND